MPSIPAAQEIVLELKKPLAPPFHRHIARAKLLGTTCQAGETVVVYEIVSTTPSGLVSVEKQTLIRFV